MPPNDDDEVRAAIDLLGELGHFLALTALEKSLEKMSRQELATAVGNLHTVLLRAIQAVEGVNIREAVFVVNKRWDTMREAVLAQNPDVTN